MRNASIRHACRTVISTFLVLLFFPNSTLFAQVADSALFRDDFDRNDFGSSWQADESWSIVDGSAHNFTDGPGSVLKTTAGYPQPSYVVETSARGFNANYYRYFRITFGQEDLTNNNQLYELVYTGFLGSTLTLARATDNVYYPQVLDEVAEYPGLSASQNYTFKIARYQSGLIQVYVDKGSGYDSIPLLEAIDSTYGQLGHVGWQVDTDTYPEDFYVDWISATKPGIEKPAVREKPVEDSLITQVMAASGRPYTVSKLAAGVKEYIDRDYQLPLFPSI